MTIKLNKGFKKFLIILIIFFVLVTAYYLSGPYLPFVNQYVSNTDYIAVLYIEGTIMEGSTDVFGEGSSYNQQYILSQIDAFIHDDFNKGLVVFVDTPGGGIYETDEVYLKLLEYKEKTGCPVYISMGSMAASGGYYISAAGDKIFANRNTLTGSIGVTMGTFYDISDFLDEHGIKTVTMTAGKNKAMGSITEPLSQEQIEIFQSLLNESYNQFVEVIAKGRNMELDDVKEIADGRLYSAKQAKNLGLVDNIGTLGDAIDEIKSDYELNNCAVREFFYQDDSIISLLKGYSRLAIRSNKGDIGTVIDLLNNQNNVPIAYLYDLN